MVVLGFHEIQNIALSMSVVKLFDRRGSEFTERLWRHSFSVGVACRMVASYLNLKLDGKYFVGGLLHDVGKIFLSQYMPDEFERMLKYMESGENKYTYHVLEEQWYGIPHAEIGGELLNSWMFPSDITEAVTCHHEPSLASTDIIFTACVHLADILCSIKGITPLKDHFFLTVDENILPVLYALKEDFDADDMEKLLAQIDLEIERQSSFVSAFKR